LTFELDLSGLPDPPFTVQNGSKPVTGGESEPFTVEENGSKTLTVVFTPGTQAGPSMGVIGIHSSYSADPYYPINVTATAKSGRLGISPKTLEKTPELNFHNVRLGQAKTKSLTLTNGGIGLLTVTVGNNLIPPFYYVKDNPDIFTPFTLHPEESRAVNVQFEPSTGIQTPSTFTQTLTITSDDPSALMVPVTVIGMAVSIGTGAGDY